MTADLLSALHQVLQFGFLAVTLLLMLVTVVNRLRVRGVVLTWQRGPLLGWPAWPVAFLFVVASFLAVALATEQPLAPGWFVGYLVGGAFWLVAARLSAAVLVTEYGLVPDAGRPDRAIAWEQMVDYFKASDEPIRYAFFYLDAADVRRREELTVPRYAAPAFRELLAEHLDARFNETMEQVYGKQTLEG